MKYLSLFSGIGCFEVAIHTVFPDAINVGYSEISKDAIKVYESHFPSHTNLGDITKLISPPVCDLIVSGFPCQNLSSMASIKGDSRGLEGKSSSLFYDMLRVIQSVKSLNPDVKFIIENNASMTLKNRILITEILSNSNCGRIFSVVLNNASFGVQTRRRIIWSNFKIEGDMNMEQHWKDVLVPIKDVKLICSPQLVKCYNKIVGKEKRDVKIAVPIGDNRYKFIITTSGNASRWDSFGVSDTMEIQEYKPYPLHKSRPILRGYNSLLIDRRVGIDGSFIFRRLEIVELERLFGLPDGYTSSLKSYGSKSNVLGNALSVFMGRYILSSLHFDKKSD